MPLRKYLKYKLFFFKHKSIDSITIKKGLISSIGWNLGKIPKSIHLLDPFTSIPKKGTRINNNKKTINNILDIYIKLSLFKDEK